MRILIRVGFGTIAILLGCLLYWARTVGPLRDPHDALTEFCTGDGRAEDQLMDPLILAGPRVLSVVTAAVADRRMPRRRYAIAFLGICSYRSATPLLASIATDSTELDYFRADALEALFQIAPKQAQALASPLASRADFLGQRAKLVLSGKGIPGFERSYLQALRGDHD